MIVPREALIALDVGDQTFELGLKRLVRAGFKYEVDGKDYYLKDSTGRYVAIIAPPGERDLSGDQAKPSLTPQEAQGLGKGEPARAVKVLGSGRGHPPIKFISHGSPGCQDAVMVGDSDAIALDWVVRVLHAHRIEAIGGDSAAGSRGVQVKIRVVRKAREILAQAGPRDGFFLTEINSDGTRYIGSFDKGWAHIALRHPMKAPVDRKHIPQELRVFPATWAPLFDQGFYAGWTFDAVDYRKRYCTLRGRRHLLGYEARFVGLDKRGE